MLLNITVNAEHRAQPASWNKRSSTIKRIDNDEARSESANIYVSISLPRTLEVNVPNLVTSRSGHISHPLHAAIIALLKDF
jgi:hypothetical protein